MTVKEAIYKLNFALGEIYDQVFYDDKPYEFDKDEYEAFDMAIESLKQTQWIPCEERLPEEGNTTYMVTVDYGEFGGGTGQRFYYGKDIGWDDDAVVAWRPLPKPYEGR